MARQIGTLGRALYASPAYAKAHGLPARPEELSAHTLVTNSAVTVLNDWPFRVEGEPRIYGEGKWRANDTNMAAAMVLQGVGIGRLATLVGEVLVARGGLVPVLPQLVDLRPVPVYAVTGNAAPAAEDPGLPGVLDGVVREGVIVIGGVRWSLTVRGVAAPPYSGVAVPTCRRGRSDFV